MIDELNKLVFPPIKKKEPRSRLLIQAKKHVSDGRAVCVLKFLKI